MSISRLSDAEAWELLSTDPLAYIRELALAHEEKLRDENEPCAVLVLNDHRRETT